MKSDDERGRLSALKISDWDEFAGRTVDRFVSANYDMDVMFFTDGRFAVLYELESGGVTLDCGLPDWDACAVAGLIDAATLKEINDERAAEYAAARERAERQELARLKQKYEAK